MCTCSVRTCNDRPARWDVRKGDPRTSRILVFISSPLCFPYPLLFPPLLSASSLSVNARTCSGTSWSLEAFHVLSPFRVLYVQTKLWSTQKAYLERYRTHYQKSKNQHIKNYHIFCHSWRKVNPPNELTNAALGLTLNFPEATCDDQIHLWHIKKKILGTHASAK